MGAPSRACHATVRFTLPRYHMGTPPAPDLAAMVGSVAIASWIAASSSLNVTPSCHVASSGNTNCPRGPFPFTPYTNGGVGVSPFSEPSGRKICIR